MYASASAKNATVTRRMTTSSMALPRSLLGTDPEDDAGRERRLSRRKRCAPRGEHGVIGEVAAQFETKQEAIACTPFAGRGHLLQQLRDAAKQPARVVEVFVADGAGPGAVERPAVDTEAGERAGRSRA